MKNRKQMSLDEMIKILGQMDYINFSNNCRGGLIEIPQVIADCKRINLGQLHSLYVTNLVSGRTGELFASFLENIHDYKRALKNYFTFLTNSWENRNTEGFSEELKNKTANIERLESELSPLRDRLFEDKDFLIGEVKKAVRPNHKVVLGHALSQLIPNEMGSPAIESYAFGIYHDPFTGKELPIVKEHLDRTGLLNLADRRTSKMNFGMGVINDEREMRSYLTFVASNYHHKKLYDQDIYIGRRDV